MTKNQFVEMVRKELGLHDSAYAEMAVEAVLKTLHDRLSEGEADHIESHLPKELKPLWSRSLTDRLVAMWRGPEKMNKSEFLSRVQHRAHLEDREKSEHLAQGVFKALKHQLPAKDAENVGTQLPKDLKNLWRIA